MGSLEVEITNTDVRSGNGAPAEVRDAHRQIGDRPVLQGVDLYLRRGEIYGLLGPNGAGKTSLVRAICGRLALDSGSVRIAGADPRLQPHVRRRLGVVPQAIALYPELTVGENLEILGRLAGVPRRDLPAAVENALGWTDLTERRRDPVSTLSGGMQRRLNIAAGTLHDPEVLLLDEPTVGVDPSAREKIHELLLELRARGLAVLLTTHDLEQAESLADRIGILVSGRIRAEGSLESLVRSAFGDARELTVSLSHDPDERGRALLQREGLAPVQDEKVWSGSLDGGYESLSELGGRMSDSGLKVAEVRVREPGLRGVFFRLAGKELDE
jgi:ABC-2 type transport system ATP-binding protein